MNHEIMASMPSYEIIAIVFMVTTFTQDTFQLDNNRIYNCYLDICNKHSTSCSQRTATCRYCKDNTYGPYCNLCKDGYYGNATESKHGCKRCPCPFIKSNGSCTHDKAKKLIRCHDCKPGYHGDLCDQCTIGYYKNRTDGLCRPCNCNGHGNTTLKQPCEPIGGRCLQCLHRTTGLQCEQCMSGYFWQYKNATRQCIECNCNGNSMPNVLPICDWKSGICIQCTRNTSGVNCENCAHGYQGDALKARNCSFIHHHVFVRSPAPSKHLIVALISVLAIIIVTLLTISIYIWWKRRKTRDPLGFITINMNHSDEDDYNIAWIDPVTGDPIRHNEVDTEMPVANGNLELHDEYDDQVDDLHGAEYESRDTDRML